MIFKIIPNENTPRIIEEYTPISILLAEQYDMLTKFLSYARTQKKGIGLASNQVKVGTKKEMKRIMEPFFAIKNGLTWELMIHPRIHRYHGKGFNQTESCLTWLGKKMVVKRWDRITASYWTLNGELKREEITGLTAQIFQHEYDHLLGVPEKMIYEDK